MITETDKPLPEIILTERAAQVFKEACEAEGTSLEDTFMRIGARPGGCSGWKYELESSKPQDVGPNDVKIISKKISVVVDREALTDILGPLKIDFSDKNLVEQGFVFEQLKTGHQCGCGESFTPVKDLKGDNNNGPLS